MTAVLRIEQLEVWFNRQTAARQRAVHDVSFSIQPGESLALVGESGCGKSTTALSVLRLLPHTAETRGRIVFDDVDLLALPLPELRAIRGRRIAMIFQDPMTSLNPVMTVGDQIVEVLRRLPGTTKAAAHKRAVELLDLVRIPDPHQRAHDYPHHLSGGQRQRAMIAMAVACSPQLLIADEPTTALDATVQAEIFELLDGLRKQLAMALLLITHDLGVVARWADRVVVMYGGETVEQSPVADILARPHHDYTRGLIETSLHSGRGLHYSVAALPEMQVTISDTGQIQVIRRTATAQPPRADSKSTSLLSARDLRVEYTRHRRTFVALDGVSLDITRGETVGLVGESGCGKSTLSRTLLGLIKPVRGCVELTGQDILSASRAQLKQYRRDVRIVFQDPYASLNPRQTAGEILDASLRAHGLDDAVSRRREIAHVLGRVGLPVAAAAKYPHELSGGQRQRIGIARALVLHPKLIVLDEPVSALDVSTQAQILNLLVELKQQLGLSYLFVSHDLAVVRYMADRVVVMDSGKIVETGAVDEVWDRPQSHHTRQLIAASLGRLSATGV
ncbi:MAG: ABC transporter ATP-binding protein [Polyangiales bacterium]